MSAFTTDIPKETRRLSAIAPSQLRRDVILNPPSEAWLSRKRSQMERESRQEGKEDAKRHSADVGHPNCSRVVAERGETSDGRGREREEEKTGKVSGTS